MIKTTRRKGKFKMLPVNPGDRFGKLTVIKEVDRFVQPSGQTNRAMLCKCDCGNEKVVRVANLTRGKVYTCGCLHPKHGMSETKIYVVWKAMHHRCYNDSCIDHHRYKNRGIEMCPEWKASFIAFKDWALANGYKHGLQIDRRDNDKGYGPDNCRFVTPIENSNNREVTTWVAYGGKMVSLQLILREKNLLPHIAAIRARIARGWPHDEAIDTPIKEGKYKRNAVPAN